MIWARMEMGSVEHFVNHLDCELLWTDHYCYFVVGT